MAVMAVMAAMEVMAACLNIMAIGIHNTLDSAIVVMVIMPILIAMVYHAMMAVITIARMVGVAVMALIVATIDVDSICVECYEVCKFLFGF